jgi:hypothetical protein
VILQKKPSNPHEIVNRCNVINLKPALKYATFVKLSDKKENADAPS